MKQIHFFIFFLLFFVQSYGAQGTLDPSFSGDGIVVTDIPGASTSTINSVAIQNDLKILAAGTAQTSTTVMTITRYQTDGNLDSTFGGSGIVINPASFESSSANSVKIQGNKILVGGNAGLVGSPSLQFTIVRLNPNGSVDATFNGGGFTRTTIGSSSTINEIIVTKDSIYAAGRSTISGVTYFTIAKYSSDGILDTTFNPTGTTSGVPGVVATSINGSTNSIINDIVVRNNQIIAVGQAVISGSNQIAIAVYNATTGALDTTFNPTGIQPGTLVQVVPGSSSSFANGVALSDDNFVLVGQGINTSSSSIVLAKYDFVGNLDDSFGSNGIVITNGGSTGTDIVIQKDQKIIISGARFQTDTLNVSFLVARYNPDGSLDQTFNPNGDEPGINVTPINSIAIANSLLLQPDNKIVLGGLSGADFNSSTFTLTRYIGDLTFVTIDFPVDGETVTLNPGQSLTITGTMEQGNRIVRVSINGGAPQQADVNPNDGTWSFTTSDFEIGSNTVTVTTVDPAGSTATATVTFRVRIGCILNIDALSLAIRQKYQN